MNFYEKVSEYARKAVVPIVAGVGLMTIVGCTRQAVKPGIDQKVYGNGSATIEVYNQYIFPVECEPAPTAVETVYVKHSGRIEVDVDECNRGHHSRADKPGDASGL